MNKLFLKGLSILLTISLISLPCRTCAEIGQTEPVQRDFRTLQLSELKLLETPAPESSFAFYALPNNWNVINTNFLNKIDLKLNEYAAHMSVVEPVINQIIEKPTPISWYQEPTIIAFGVPIVFVGGVMLGVWLVK